MKKTVFFHKMKDDEIRNHANDFYGKYDKYQNDAVEVLNGYSDSSILEKAIKLVYKIPKLKDLVDDVPTMVNMVKDYIKGNYKRIPYKTVVLTAGALIYLANPIDAVPDTVPVAGYMDDAAVISCVLKAVEDDIEEYKVWQRTEHSA